MKTDRDAEGEGVFLGLSSEARSAASAVDDADTAPVSAVVAGGAPATGAPANGAHAPRGGAEDGPSASWRDTATREDPLGAYDPRDGDDDLAGEVAEQVRRLEVQDRARREHARRTGRTVDPPAIRRLHEFLAEPDDPVVWRVADLMPAGARVMLTAQYKAGKSTLVGNLVRCLVDGDRFLGRYATAATGRAVAVIDDELAAGMLRRWYRDQGIVRTEAVHLLPLRGAVASFDVLDPTVRRDWAARLAGLDVGVLVLDCLAPLLSSLGVDENSEVGRVLDALDALVAKAGVDELVVVHHMGHGAERGRGSSRLRDWPDVEWRLVREAEDGHEPAPDARRYLTAFGRDVNVAEQRLAFDTDARRLTVAGGSRAHEQGARRRAQVREFVLANPGASVKDIKDEVGGKGQDVSNLLASMVTDGVLRREAEGRSKRHYVADGP